MTEIYDYANTRPAEVAKQVAMILDIGIDNLNLDLARLEALRPALSLATLARDNGWGVQQVMDFQNNLEIESLLK